MPSKEKQIKYVDPDNGPTDDARNDSMERKLNNLQYRNPEAMQKRLANNKKRRAVVWDTVIPLADRVKELDDIGMKFLNNKTKLTKDQLAVWKVFFETYSSKLLPNLAPKKSAEKATKPVFKFTGAPLKETKVETEEDDFDEEIE